MTETLEIAIANLNGEEWPVILKGLKSLKSLLEQDETIAETVVKDHITDLCVRFNYDREQVRNYIVIIIEKLVDITPPTDVLLCHVTAALCRRLGSPSIEEQCEELRLHMMKMLHQIIKVCSPNPALVFPYFSSIKQILIKTLTDPFGDVRKVSCETVVLLSEVLKKDFHMESEGFIDPVLLSFSHNNNKIRVAAISCIGSIVMHGSSTCFEKCITPLAGKLLDDNPHVRLEVAKQVGNLMLNYPHRYSNWHKMLPLLLTCLNDSYSNVSQEAELLWNEVGLKYIKENEDDLKDQLNFGDAPPSHYPPVNRPNLGCRKIVEQNIGKILPAILRELQGWQTDIRLRCSHLVINLILGAEFSLLQHVNLVISCLIQELQDEEFTVVMRAYFGAELLGYFVEPRVWWKILSPRCEEWTVLDVLSYLIQGTKVGGLSTKYLKKIVSKLSNPDVYKTNNVKYQKGLINVCGSLLQNSKENCDIIAQEIFNLSFTVYCMNCNESLGNEALGVLKELQRITEWDNDHDIVDLYKKHLRGVLINVTSSVNTWNEYSPDLAIMNTCLSEGGPALGVNLAVLSPILAEALTQDDVDAEVKIKVFRALSTMLLAKESSFLLSEEEFMIAFIRIIVDEIIFPNLIWSAGRTAEAIRTSAVCCLCSLLEECPNEENNKFSDIMVVILGEKLDKLYPLLATLVDDNSKLTRQYALRAIYYTTKITSDCGFNNEILHKTFPVILKRLDDTNLKVRLAAIETLSMLFEHRRTPYDLIVYGAHPDAVYNTMLIHLDDPNEEVKTAILVALNKLIDLHPKLLDKKIKANLPIYTNKSALLELEENIKNLNIESE